MDESTNLSELDAATFYARAWNRLDCADFVALLAPDARYASQWVIAELHGRDEIGDYLARKMEAVKNSEGKVYAELAKTTESEPGRYCVALAQNEVESVKAVVLFEVSGGRISRFNLCMPELYGIVRSGEYPS